MPGARASSATPYAVVVVYRERRGVEQRHVTCYRKHLGTALELARKTDLAWTRLIGGQFSPLHWVVIDTRDYTEHNPFTSTDPGGSHAQSSKRKGRPHA
jgi:hypothetical protein